MKNKKTLLTNILALFLILNISFFANAYTIDSDYEKLLKKIYKNSVPFIQVFELKELIDNNKDIVILDTREKNEYDVSRIKGAIFAGFDKFDISLLKDISKDKKIILYCSVGYRSEKIGEILIKNGYKNVYNLYGGIFLWINQDYSVFNDDGITNRIHGYTKKWGKWIRKGSVIYNK